MGLLSGIWELDRGLHTPIMENEMGTLLPVSQRPLTPRSLRFGIWEQWFILERTPVCVRRPKVKSKRLRTLHRGNSEAKNKSLDLTPKEFPTRNPNSL